ncbi:hypothetical protein ABEG18_17860 [Alsobacter sp. KACC 23698]|uniref:WD40 repeat domain-containing protein n=1 Tax=Alsobacter sp. KACC 23698 TaxID=3149229 RepID=A0AAU7JBC3_9HYPH
MNTAGDEQKRFDVEPGKGFESFSAGSLGPGPPDPTSATSEDGSVHRPPVSESANVDATPTDSSGPRGASGRWNIAAWLPSFADVAPVAMGGLGMITVSAFLAFAASRFGHVQTVVSDKSVAMGASAGRVTAMAWSSQEGGPLTIGTERGYLINIGRDGVPVVLPSRPYAPGAMVRIFPSDVDHSAEGVWASGDGGYAGFRVGTEPTYRGFAFRAGGSLKGIPPTANGGLTSNPIIRTMLRNASNAIIGPTQATNTPYYGPDRLSAIAGDSGGSSSYVLAGYESGAVLGFPTSAATQIAPSQPQNSKGIARIHLGPVIAIAVRPFAPQPSDLFATGAADGTVAVFGLTGYSVETAEGRLVLFEKGAIDGVAGSAPSEHGSVPTRDGLMLDRSGRVLLLWDQEGEIWVARLGLEDTPVLRRYSLNRVSQTEPNSWSPITAASLSPRGDLFAVAGGDGRVWIVVLPTDPRSAPSSARTVRLLGHGAQVIKIAISVDGRMLASLDATGRLLLTDLDRFLNIVTLPLSEFSTDKPPDNLTPIPPSDEALQRFSTTSTTDADMNSVISMLRDAVVQTQKMVKLMVQSCPGGANGQNPNRFDVFVSLGNDVQNFLFDLIKTLENGRVENAGTQLSVIKGSLNNMVRIMAKQCSGGDQGRDPLNYDELVASERRVQDSLDQAKQKLAKGK